MLVYCVPDVGSIFIELQNMCASDPRAPNNSTRSPFLEQNRERVRQLGEQLDRIGGYPLMLTVCQALPIYDASDLEFAWDGIGVWQC